MRTRRRTTSEVVIARDENESKAVTQCLDILNFKTLITKDDIVVVTTNWVNQITPDTGIVVGTETLRTILRAIKALNPKRIVVASGSGGKETTEIEEYVGFDKILKEEDVEFVDLNHGPFIRLNINHDKPSSTNLNNLIQEMTFHISFTQLKHHEEATMSASIKNVALGWPPAEEHGFPKKNLGIHEKLHGFITSMVEVIPIDMSIVSASPAMVGTGPSKGVTKHTQIVVAGTDAVSVDTVCARLLGFKPQAVNYLFDCTNKKLGISVLNEIELKGLDIKEAERHFSSIVYGNPMSVDEK